MIQIYFLSRKRPRMWTISTRISLTKMPYSRPWRPLCCPRSTRTSSMDSPSPRRKCWSTAHHNENQGKMKMHSGVWDAWWSRWDHVGFIVTWLNQTIYCGHVWACTRTDAVSQMLFWCVDPCLIIKILPISGRQFWHFICPVLLKAWILETRSDTKRSNLMLFHMKFKSHYEMEKDFIFSPLIRLYICLFAFNIV